MTNVAAQTLTGTAEAGSTVTISRGATTFPSVVAAGNGTYSVPVTLVQGANSFTAVATDQAGNTSPASTAIMATLDTVLPSLTITDPKALAYRNTTGPAANRWANTCAGAPGACGTASDSGSGVASVRLELRNTATNTCWTGTGTTYGCLRDRLSRSPGPRPGPGPSRTASWRDGSLQLTITVTDLAGNVTTGSISFTAE